MANANFSGLTGWPVFAHISPLGCAVDEFSVLAANILGQVYEQFLGRVIRLTPAHRAVVEEKPEVKKAGGVYYTPTYIVDYIVENTIGAWLQEKSLNQAAALRVLDVGLIFDRCVSISAGLVPRPI
jgi:hypothetical protein